MSVATDPRSPTSRGCGGPRSASLLQLAGARPDRRAAGGSLVRTRSCAAGTPDHLDRSRAQRPAAGHSRRPDRRAVRSSIPTPAASTSRQPSASPDAGIILRVRSADERRHPVLVSSCSSGWRLAASSTSASIACRRGVRRQPRLALPVCGYALRLVRQHPGRQLRRCSADVAGRAAPDFAPLPDRRADRRMGVFVLHLLRVRRTARSSFRGWCSRAP